MLDLGGGGDQLNQITHKVKCRWIDHPAEPTEFCQLKRIFSVISRNVERIYYLFQLNAAISWAK